MTLVRAIQKKPIVLRLNRDLVRLVKRGHPWVFADALQQQPKAPAGSQAVLLDHKKGREIARGFYDAASPLAFRVCSIEPDEPLDTAWAERQMHRAVAVRQMLFDDSTTGYRLFNGEGDGLPGLICDVYGDTAVIQLDGAGPAGFWQVSELSRWLVDVLSLRRVYLRPQSRQKGEGQALVGDSPIAPIFFLENNARFTVDVIRGQKTGFFLDQRENRALVGKMAKGRDVLNVFGYTGGFSVQAGLGGANQVITVDLAEPALKKSDAHWDLNELPTDHHQSVKADAFEYLERAAKARKQWDFVIVDPPSFAPSKSAVPQALKAYQKLVAISASVTKSDGLLAASSCSSHVDMPAFLQACEEGISNARRRATLLGAYGQSADHPSPLVFSEFRYLKFVLMRIE